MNYFDNLAALLTTLCALYGCGSGGDGATTVPPFLAQGTVISQTCPGTTLVKEIADGQGGSSPTRTENSAQCGYTEPPPAGTLLNSGCSKDYPGVKWFQYADGEGGTYS